ncbi:MAG: hemerythrin domain-containing protein [Magnetospirillum sp.]|nr:hemerythrin domain-containing protein [Magnetospirillum sp.]
MEGDNYLWRIDWRDEFLIGDPIVDAQHRSFFEDVGQLRLALLAAEPQAKFLEYCDAFTESARTHFAEEERLMDRIGFPRLREHRFEHALLLTRVEEARREIAEAGCLLDCMMATRSLMVMLVEHLLHEDMRIKAFLSGKAPTQ